MPDNAPVPDHPPPLRWDIFCQVVDNHGDLGVCWRLACALTARGQQVRLWIDDARALAWMAPEATRPPAVQVLPWTQPLDARLLANLPPEPRARLAAEALAQQEGKDDANGDR